VFESHIGVGLGVVWRSLDLILRSIVVVVLGVEISAALALVLVMGFSNVLSSWSSSAVVVVVAD
jgi:hypothetical protein